MPCRALRSRLVILTVLALVPAAASAEWLIRDVDAPKAFDQTSLKFNSLNQPCVAYGGDHLYYAVRASGAWTIATVDPGRGVGLHPSLAFDRNGLPAISYYDAVNGDLRFARNTGSGWTLETVDAASDAGFYSSLAFDAQAGAFVVSYYDRGRGALKVARRAVSSWTLETVDSSSDTGYYSSLAVAPDGTAYVAYYDLTLGDLKLATRNAGVWTTQTLDSAGDAGRYPSIALDQNRLPMIAYYNAADGDLLFARHAGGQWSFEIVDSDLDTGLYASVVLNETLFEPEIGYYDSTNGDLKLARHRTDRWEIETVDSISDTGLFGSIARAPDSPDPRMAYLDRANGLLKYASYDPASSRWVAEELDRTADVGRFSSLAVDSLDRPGVAYYDATARDLKAARWNGFAWSIETVDWASEVGQFCSLAFVPDDDTPAISYYDATGGDLKLALRSGSGWDASAVLSENDAGRYTSLAFDSLGAPWVSFFDGTLRKVRLAHFIDRWLVRTVDPVSTAGQYTSLARDGAGGPAVSYYQGRLGSLRFARDLLGVPAISDVDSGGNVGAYSSVAIDAAGLPAVSYYAMTTRDLRVARWDGAAWSVETVDSDGDVGAYTSLAFGPYGHPMVSYLDRTRRDLKLARWDGAAWSVETVDSDGDVGEYTSLAVDATGNPVISYYDRTNGSLKVAVTPYLRFDSFRLDQDACAFGSPPGGDSRVNPGEDVHFSIGIRNLSGTDAHTWVSASIESLTPGVSPATIETIFPDMPPLGAAWNQGGPLLVSVPEWIECGDAVRFRIVLASAETGALPAQLFSVPVNGLPASCKCRAAAPPLSVQPAALEADRCAFLSPPGSDSKVNPGEQVDVRVRVRNDSGRRADEVVGTLAALSPGVNPAPTALTFGTISDGATASHTGAPVTFDVPLTAACGDDLLFTLTLSSRQSGTLPAQQFAIRVNGDPARCACVDPGPDLAAEGLLLEADRCPYSTAQDRDLRANPGESVDLRLAVRNRSALVDYHDVVAEISSLTPSVSPAQATLSFGTVAASGTAAHQGAPLAVSLPLSLACGDMAEFRVTLSSREAGAQAGGIVTLPIDGDEGDCPCTPRDLYYEAYSVESDRCDSAAPPGEDGRINPGEIAGLRFTVRNGSALPLDGVTATLEALTPDLLPATAILSFGTIAGGDAAGHLGDILAVTVPRALSCGDDFSFLLTLSSDQTGSLPADTVVIPVDGDPADCLCRPAGLAYVSYSLEADRCVYLSPPGADGRVNPGEEADLRLFVRNWSSDPAGPITATLEAVTPGVTLSASTLDFGTVAAGGTAAHLGVPLTVSVPSGLSCPDVVRIGMTLSSPQFGTQPASEIEVAVDGDPADCVCAPVGLVLDSYALEADRCAYTSPPGNDGRVNPGEQIDVRIRAYNNSPVDVGPAFGYVEAATPGVLLSSTVFYFGTVPIGVIAPHQGSPLMLTLPPDLSCGDEIRLRVSFTSGQYGMERPQEIAIPVDGDPARCLCEPAGLFYDSYALEADRCAGGSPPGGDLRVNPGEDIDSRFYLHNGAGDPVGPAAGTLAAITSGVVLSTSALDFGTIAGGVTAPHQGSPVTITVPRSLSCRDTMRLRLTLESPQYGTHAPVEIIVPVDGDPAQCVCPEAPQLLLHKGTVLSLTQRWRASALPLTPDNDDETPPFPVPIALPSEAADVLDPLAALNLYTVLGSDGAPQPGIALTVVKAAGGLSIHAR